MNRHKAQLFSLDAVVAIGIFIIIMVSAMWIWDYSREKVYLTELREDLELAARTALSSLVETPGNPASWHNDQDSFNTTEVNSLGLSRGRPWVLLDDKVQSLQDWYPSDNQTCKELLGIQGYGYHLQMWKYNGGFPEDPDYEAGSSPTGTYNVVRVQRLALLSEGASTSWLKIVLELWET